MAQIKTYGARGFLEYETVIRHGKASFHFHFSGGCSTGYGFSPAEYTTKNQALQHIIESSTEFKRGIIFVLRVINVEDKPADKKTTSKSEEKETTAELEEVNVSCLDDAKEYLCNNFGVDARTLRSAKAIRDTAKAKGIVFVGI